MKSELQKLKDMEPYNCDDPEVMAAKKHACILANEFNNSSEDDMERRTAILQELFGDCGEGVFVKPPFHCDYGFNIHIGKNFFGNFDCIMLDGAPIHIGDNCLMGPKTCLYSVSHTFDPEERARHVNVVKPINIGNDVWFGGNCVVLPGVTIGNDVVVGAGSVVTKDIPDHTVVAGNPARILRRTDNYKRLKS